MGFRVTEDQQALQEGEVQVALGRHGEAGAQLERALAILGAGVPSRRTAAALLAAGQVVRQLAHRALPAGPAHADDTDLRIARAYEQLGYVYYAAGDTVQGIHAALRMLNHAERAAHASDVLARAYAAMSLTVSVTPLRAAGGFYERMARTVAARLREETTSGWVNWIAALRAAGEGRLETVRRASLDAVACAERAADQRLWIMATLTGAWGANQEGRHEFAFELAETALERALTHGNRLWEAWALIARAEAAIEHGDPAATAEDCRRALDILAEQSDRTEEIRAGGLRARALFRLGERDDASLEAAAHVLSAAEGVDLTAFNMFEGFAGLCEFYIGLAATEPASAGRERLNDARRALRALARFRRVFPVASARYDSLRRRLEEKA